MEPQREITVQEVALNNPLILTEILKQSSTPLKSCRLVSHFWNDMVLSLPKSRLAVTLKNGYGDDPVPFFELCCKLSDDRLAKHVSASTFYCGTHHFAARLMHICDKFSDRVQILELWIDAEECLPSIFLIFKNSCPNLKQLRIRCTYDEGECVPNEEQVLVKKPNLTVFELNSEMVTPSLGLTGFTQLVVNSAPNLKEVTLPWGVYPDLATSQVLDSLTLQLDDILSLNDALKQLKPSELTRMLNQVSDQLVHLDFSYSHFYERHSMKYEANELDNNSTRPRLRLLGRLSNLRTFSNEMIDIIQHVDFWQDIGQMPALESLRIGKLSKKETHIDAVLKNLTETGRIFRKVTQLKIHELYDPTLLDGLKTAFPNLKTLGLDSLHKATGGMELGVVLKACAGFGGLNRLDLWLPTYPGRMREVCKALLKGSELYRELNRLEIRTHSRNRIRHELTEAEMYLFTRLLFAMKGMDQVVIHDLYFGDESLRNMQDFMASNEMPVSKFNVLQVGWTDDVSDSE